MNVLPSGSYDVVTETGMPALMQILSVSLSSVIYINQSYTFTINYQTDVYYLTDSQSLSVIEKTNTQVLPDLSCSLSNSTSVMFSLCSYNNVNAPSWIAIDANTGLLTINSPEVDQNTNYSFYVNAVTTGVSQQIQKLIKLTVTNWTTWGSQTAKVLSITVMSIVAIVFITSTISSILNSQSSWSVWLLINQVQIFFLLLLTRAYIPDDVKLVITGLKFALNPTSYFSFNSITAYNSALNNFDFELNNNSLSYVGVNSDSSVYNLSPFIVTMLAMLAVHLVVLVLSKLLTKCRTDWRWGWLIKFMKWATEKLFKFLTFSFYIRTVLEMDQFLLICSVYEVYSFNISQLFRVISLGFAMLTIAAWVITSAFVFYLSASLYTVDESKHSKLGEFFNGLKMQRRFKLHAFMLMLRRTVFVVLLLMWDSVASRLLIGVLAFLQLIYLAYVCFMRPFWQFKDNLIEIVNEIYFLLLLSTLIYLNEESYWSPTATSIYIWSVFSNSMVVFVISMSRFLPLHSNIVDNIKVWIINWRNWNESQGIPFVGQFSTNCIKY